MAKETKTHNRSNVVTNSIKTLKMVHIKKKKKKDKAHTMSSKTLNSRKWFVNGVNGGATIIIERAMIQGSQVKIPGGETVYTSDPLIPSLLPSQDPGVELAG